MAETRFIYVGFNDTSREPSGAIRVATVTNVSGHQVEYCLAGMPGRQYAVVGLGRLESVRLPATIGEGFYFIEGRFADTKEAFYASTNAEGSDADEGVTLDAENVELVSRTRDGASRQYGATPSGATELAHPAEPRNRYSGYGQRARAR